ncbi:hypothetical protein ACEWY4_017125 [Coilia grayii]|uniref:C2H2-type domain-containing protein n=1 Tax=Coilia grayii TaxID=363190 RepID=A0ABD1JFX8_9TELE
MQKRVDHTQQWRSSRPEGFKSHLPRFARYQSVHTLESKIHDISQHVDVSHKQACSDLEKVSKFITEALQSEVQRNMALRMSIHRLEERASENGRSLSEHVESNRQLKLQVDELQKHLQDKDNSLTQANQTVAFLKHQLRDLYQQLHSHQSNHRTIQEVTEWLQDGEGQPIVVESESIPSCPIEPLVSGGPAPHGQLSSDGQSQLLAPVSGIKEEDTDDGGYEYSQSDGVESKEEQTASLARGIKVEEVEGEERSDMAPCVSSGAGAPGVPSEAQWRGTTTDATEPHTHDKNSWDGEQPESGNRSRLSSSAGPALPVVSHPKTNASTTHLCSVCGKGFPYWSNLQLHYATHAGDRPHACARCGKSFGLHKHLKQHERTHTGERPYPCAQCGKSFALAKHLKQHQRIHTGEKPFRCGHCGKTFTFVGNLRVHERTHTGERPYRCTQCGKSFAFVGNLRTHERIHRRIPEWRDVH